MTVEELEKATGKELIEERDYCGVDGYRGDYLDDVNAEMLKRFNRFAELEKENAELKEENTELKTKKIPQLERKIASIRGCHSVAVKKLNARIEQVKRLKKENAELRQKLRSKL